MRLSPIRRAPRNSISWPMALALRSAAFELLNADGATPVLLLDDVFAELDTARRAALAGVAESAEQVLITAAVPEDIPGNWAPKRITIDMADRLSVLVS